MKVETVEQFKIMEFLKANFEVNYLVITLVSRNSIKILDMNNDTAIFTFNEETGKIDILFDSDFIDY